MVEVLERGDIRFFWRPTVQPADGAMRELASDEHVGVQSFFLLLSNEQGTHRRVRIGKKRMPSRAAQRFWARVERVGSFGRAIGDQLESEHYTTKTRGERYQPPARAIAHGCYAFVRHDDHCHLAYRLDQIEPDEIPDEVRVAEAGSHVVLFERVPRTRATWTTAGDPTMLDEEGAECVLVAAGDEPERVLGIDILTPAPDELPAQSGQ